MKRLAGCQVFAAVLFAVALMLTCVAASAAPKACERASYLADEVSGCLETIAELEALASQYCAEPALKRECARQRIEIRAWEQTLRDTVAELKAANRECRGRP